MTPLGSGHLGELFLAQTTRLRSRRGAARVLSAAPNRSNRHDELYHLAYAVLRQACADAGHPGFCGYHNRVRFEQAIHNHYRRDAAWDALLFLTDPQDEWLPYWCQLAGLNPTVFRGAFQPIRQAFEAVTGFKFDHA